MSFRKGKCLKALKQLDEAVKCYFDQIIKENGHFPAAYICKSECLYEEK